MSVTFRRLAAGAVATLAAVVVTTVGGMPAASADPVTVTGSGFAWNSSITVSDTTPEVGDVITLDHQVVGTRPGTAVLSSRETIRSTDGTTPFGSLLVDSQCISTPATSVERFDCETPGTSPPSEFTYLALFTPPVGNGMVATWSLQFTVAPAAAGQSFTLDLGVDTTTPVTFTVTSGEADVGVDLQAQSGLLTTSIPYTLHITNNGPAAASNAAVTTQLPASTQAVSGLPGDCAYNPGTDQVTCTVSSLASGAATSRSFSARQGLLTIGLPLSATATRTASTPPDPNPANDTSTASCLALTPLLVLC